MAEVTSEPMYELMKKTHERMDHLENSTGEVKHEIVAMRLQGLSTQTDINNTYAVNGRIDQRIEHCLELRELAEKPQASYEPPQI